MSTIPGNQYESETAASSQALGGSIGPLCGLLGLGSCALGLAHLNTRVSAGLLGRVPL